MATVNAAGARKTCAPIKSVPRIQQGYYMNDIETGVEFPGERFGMDGECTGAPIRKARTKQGENPERVESEKGYKILSVVMQTEIVAEQNPAGSTQLVAARRGSDDRDIPGVGL
ncbi:hypothetical protein [Streptomyces sp. NBC_00145]|uniref:hypothetical protein n=1 Tax=Streptomyces sp. NBC_00145 TaxID=2975666 RepID=UPI002E18EAFB